MYTVSILVPVYKVEKYIERCARSLFEQTYPEIEYVFVDDCSPDRSIDVLNDVVSQYPDRKSNTQVLRHSHNRGLSAARNTGIETAKGDFLCFVDSDDYLEKDAIQLLVSEQLRTNADIVSGNAIKHKLTETIELIEPKYKDKDAMVCGLIQATLDHVIWRRIIRRSLFIDHNVRMKEGVNQGEDWQVMPQLAYYASGFSTIDNFIYHYDCTNENSYMSQKGMSFNEKLCNQDVASKDIVKSFFADKARVFQDAVGMMEAKFCYQYLYKAAAYKHKEYYDLFLASLRELDDKYYQYCGWNHALKRIVTGHYGLAVLYTHFRKLLSH